MQTPRDTQRRWERKGRTDFSLGNRGRNRPGLQVSSSIWIFLVGEREVSIQEVLQKYIHLKAQGEERDILGSKNGARLGETLRSQKFHTTKRNH